MNSNPKPQSPILHTPKVYNYSNNYSIPRFNSRTSFIPKYNIERIFGDYHNQQITNLSGDNDSTSNTSNPKYEKRNIRSPKKNFQNGLNEDFSYIYSLNEQALFQLALETLQKPSENRDVLDIKVISHSTENVKFFQEYGPQTHAECCRHMMWEHGKSNCNVFELGSIGSKFYIILKGIVGIWVNLPKIILDESGKPTEQKEMVLTEVKTLGAGASFGELALLDNRPRAATIKCREDCEFAILDKQHFNEILKEKEQKKLYENVDFLFNMRVFHGLSFAALKSLFYHTNEMKIIRKQIIYRKGDDANSIYIIREGEFLLSIDVEIPIEEKCNEKLRLRKDKIVKTLELSILSPGQIFGEEEIMEKTKRNTTIACVSHSAVIYALAKKEFYRRVFLEEFSRMFLKENLKIKKKFREDRINDFIETEKIFLKPKEQDILNISNNIEISDKEKEKEKEKEQTRIFPVVLARIAQKKTLLEEMQTNFVLSEAVKESAYERYKAIKAKYPADEVSVDMQGALRKKMLKETLSTPYLRAVLKQKNENIELKRKLEMKEKKRNCALYFQEKKKEEKNNVSSESMSFFQNLQDEIKRVPYNSLVLFKRNIKEKSIDPFKKLKSISSHDKINHSSGDIQFFPLKYQIHSIMQRKTKKLFPIFKGHSRGISL